MKSTTCSIHIDLENRKEENYHKQSNELTSQECAFDITSFTQRIVPAQNARERNDLTIPDNKMGMSNLHQTTVFDQKYICAVAILWTSCFGQQKSASNLAWLYSELNFKNSWTILSVSYLETTTTHGQTLPLWFETGAPYLEYLRALRSEKPGLILWKDFWTSWIVSNTVQNYCTWNEAGYNPCSY